MNFLILFVILSLEGGFNTLTVVDTMKTMEECKSVKKETIKKYPELKDNFMCLPIVTDGYNDPI